jgi:hypothetical protein
MNLILKTIRPLLSICLIAILLACKSNQDDLVKVEKISVTYQESQDDFPNPERGFYRHSETSASNFEALDEAELKSFRTLQSIQAATYQVYSTLVFRNYILDNLDATISASFLSNVQKDFATARNAGVKLIPRFVYTVTSKSGACPEGSICPLYGDASKATIISHISQLKPVLQENADVIACVQLGFIGIWGEQYYTDFFGDASSNGHQDNKLTDKNWLDRAEVLKAMLAAVPSDRMVQVRYPQIKQRFLFGVNSLLTSSWLTEQTAFTGLDNSRIGYHNDCFLSGSNDVGTFEDYGNSATPRNSDGSVVNTLRDYMKGDSKYVAVGGETCSDAFSPANDCEPAGKAQEEFAAMHYSFLNAQYNTDVNNDWQAGGCMDKIKKNLGYRFVLVNAVLPDKVVKGTILNITLNLKNAGYASPYNKRTAKLILRNSSTGIETSFDLNSDVRKWYSGAVAVTESLKIPSDFIAGDYQLFLNLPDEYASLSKKPEFSIRLANTGVWEETTGYNNLNHTLKIN